MQVEAVTYAGQRRAMRQRTYSVLSDIKTGHRFVPMVAPPSETHNGHPGIAWEAFHKVLQPSIVPAAMVHRQIAKLNFHQSVTNLIVPNHACGLSCPFPLCN